MSIRGVLCSKASAQTTANYSTIAAITWDTDVYDTHGFHDAGGASSDIVIPASMNGLYGILTAMVSISSLTASSELQLGIYKGGSLAYIGAAANNVNSGASGNGQSGTAGWIQVTTPPVLLTTADAFSARLLCSDASVTINTESSFGLYVIGQANGTQRCHATNAAQTGKNFSTPAVVIFDGADVTDTDAIHDPTSNNTKLIIPASLNGKKGVVFGGVSTANQTANASTSIAIQKGGSLTYVGMGANSCQNQNGTTAALLQAQTQVITFNTGDQFEVLFYTIDTSVDIGAGGAVLSLWVYG